MPIVDTIQSENNKVKSFEVAVVSRFAQQLFWRFAWRSNPARRGSVSISRLPLVTVDLKYECKLEVKCKGLQAQGQLV